MNRNKIEVIEKALADAQSNVAELKAQLVEAEEGEDICSDWLLRGGDGISLHGGGIVISSDVSRADYAYRGRTFDTKEQAKQLDDNQLLYMRIVRAIAAENKKFGYVADFTNGQSNYAFHLSYGKDVVATGWNSLQAMPSFHYMHESVAPKIREQFSGEELTTFTKKGMLL